MVSSIAWVLRMTGLVLLGALATAEAAPPAGAATPARATPATAPATSAPASATATPGPARTRYTAPTPEGTFARAMERAGAGGIDGVVGLLLARWLAPEVGAGEAQRALAALGRGQGALAREARWLAASCDPALARPTGLVGNLAILGPFRDQGGGLQRPLGPEQPKQLWGDRKAVHDWGAYEVRWRPVPASAITARGVPLDLMISPRSETCTFLATKVRFAAAKTIVISAASTGSLKLSWNGIEGGRSEDLHASAVLERLAMKVQAAPGEHVLSAKVCSGSRPDGGRVVLRAHDGEGRPLDLETSADFRLPSVGRPAAQVSALPSLLGEILKTSAADQALRVALVRGLAGADDLRSPRVPGLLEGVATAATTTPDELAIAAAIAPFGAQQSGWLGQAYDRARAAGDLETASFAARRLALLRGRSGFMNWAQDTLLLPPLDKQTDPHARLMRAAVRAQPRVEAVRRKQLRELTALARSLGARGSMWLWGDISNLARELEPQTHLAATDAIAARWPHRRDLDWVEARTRLDRAEVAKAAAVALASGSLQSADGLAGLAALLTRADLQPQAAALLEEAARLSPNHGRIASALAQARYRQGDAAAAERALDRARALEPQEARHRAEARLRHPVPEGKATRGLPEGLLAAPEVFLERKRSQPAVPGEIVDRTLHDLEWVSLGADRRVSEVAHYAREIVIEPRTQAELVEPLPGRVSEILIARVHRAAGQVEPAIEQRLEGGRARIRWRKLEAGDVVEVALRWWSDGPIGLRGQQPYLFTSITGGEASTPVLHHEVIVESPEDSPLAVDVINAEGSAAPDARTDEIRNGRRVVKMRWKKPPSAKEEPLRPVRSEVLPTVLVSLYPSWEDFAAWYREAIAGFQEPDAQIERLAAELTAGKQTRDEKIASIFGYVADRIRYVNYQAAEMWLPNRPQTVLARKQGDCDDKGGLLIALLKATGIDATLVLLQTRAGRMPGLIKAGGAALPWFNHAVVYLPAQGGAPARWLNPTDAQNRAGRLHSGESGVPALIVGKEGPPVLTKTPASKPEDNEAFERWAVKLEATGAAEVVADGIHRGDKAFFLRTGMGEADARAQYVESRIFPKDWFPGVEIDKAVDFQPDLPGGAAGFRYKARLGRFARKEGRELVVPLFEAVTLTSQLAPLPTRSLPVVLPTEFAPWRDAYEIKMQAPAGHEIGALPRGGRESGGPFGDASLTITRRGREIVVRRELTLNAWMISPAEYPAWRRWLGRVDRLLHQSLRFRAAGTTPLSASAGDPS